MYETFRIIHNAVGGITLLVTLIAAGALLATATNGGWVGNLLRASSISGSIQAVIGILMVIIGATSAGFGFVVLYWYHYLAGLIAVGAVSALAARARRAPANEARRYGGIFFGAFAIVLIAFMLGQLGTPFA